ncbi:MAG: hypothetical protein HKO95_13640 [Rhodobacteraceae bacterium]|nr:hypothetical protein [Paracoccaceae bacterium]
MLFLDADLPAGALLDPPAPDPKEVLLSSEAIWYAAPAVHGEPVRALDPIGNGPVAHPADGNEGGCQVDQYGRTPCLAFTPRVASGFASSDPVDMASFSLAIIFYAPDGDGKTIAATSASGSRDYRYVSEEGGVITFGLRNDPNAAKVVRSDISRKPTLVLAHAAGADLRLAIGDAAPVSVRTDAVFQPGPQDLFIGCRRKRAGLLNAQGAARVFDVVFLPDTDVFAPAAAPLRDALMARLEEVQENGL